MRTVQIAVTGMSCGGCEERLEAALSRVEGVRSVSADHQGGSVRVLFDPLRVDETDLTGQIVACGFEASGTAEGT